MWESNAVNYLNRLTQGNPSSGSYSGQHLCWAYDPFGNRTAQSVQSAACPSAEGSVQVTAAYNAYNQVTWVQNSAPSGFSYDASGDVVADSQNQYLYDAEGRVCAVKNQPISGIYTFSGYVYDAEGTRVSKGSILSWSCDPSVNGFVADTDSVLGLSGEQVTEMRMQSNGTIGWAHTNVWAGGRVLGTYDTNGLHFYLDDPLGTRRVQTDYAGVVEQSCFSLPYGDGQSCGTTPTAHLFTGKERDAESGNDYFGARYYGSSMGRFLSPDWAVKAEPVPCAKLENPQTLNLYAGVSFTNSANGSSGIDAWGNLIQTSQVSGTGVFPMSVNQQVNYQNQFTLNGYGYDSAGNALADGSAVSACGGSTFSWNAEEMQSCSYGTTYVYDGDGARVKKSGGTLYWGNGGLAESDLSGNITNEYIFFNGRRVAQRSSGGSVNYLFSDMLGSARIVANTSGSVVNDSDFYPYGGEKVISQGLSNQHYKFTAKERDQESGNDYFGARYYASSMGRFLSPDYQNLDDDDTPEAIPNGSTGNPQSLNLYAYGRNNPLSRRDFDGHASWGPCANDSSSQCWNGDYNGERDCSGSAGCLFWNGSTNQWQQNDPTPPPPDDPTGFFMTGLMRASIATSWGDFNYGLRQMIIAPVATLIAGGGNPVAASFLVVRPLFVPKSWTEGKPGRGRREGVKFQDPENPHNSVRIMKGDPNSSNPGQQQDYMVIRKNGQTLDSSGNPSDDPAATHIPVGTDVPTNIFEGPGGAGVP